MRKFFNDFFLRMIRMQMEAIAIEGMVLTNQYSSGFGNSN
jgi:hypothetical protein